MPSSTPKPFLTVIKWFSATSWVAILWGCGHSETAAILDGLNTAFKAKPECITVQIDVPREDAPRDRFTHEALLKAGHAQIAPVEKRISFVPDRIVSVDGIRLTESGKALFVEPGSLFDNTRVCLRTGHYKATKIHAVDYGTNAQGANIATTRVSIEFISEPWLTATRDQSEWKSFWDELRDVENKQWMYRAIKSGDKFLFDKSGSKVD